MFQKKLLASAVAGVAALGISAAAIGGTYVEEPSETAFYFTAKAGYADDNWDDFEPYWFDDSGTFAAGAAIGYQMNPYLAGEVGFVWMFDNDGRESWAVDFGLKLMAPIWEQVGAFAKVGGAWFNTDFEMGGSVDNFNVTYGAGLYYNLSPEWAIEAGWQRFHGDQELFSGSAQPFADFYYGAVTYKFPSDIF